MNCLLYCWNMECMCEGALRSWRKKMMWDFSQKLKPIIQIWYRRWYARENGAAFPLRKSSGKSVIWPYTYYRSPDTTYRVAVMAERRLSKDYSARVCRDYMQPDWKLGWNVCYESTEKIGLHAFIVVLYCCGVHPSIFLNQLLKFCGCWKPSSPAISPIRLDGTDNFALAMSSILRCMSFKAERPEDWRIRSLK